MNDLVERLRPRVSLYFGRRGVEWLARLEGQLTEVAERYRLQLEPPFPNLSINYVAPAWGEDGTEVVLKLGVPNQDIAGEIDALHEFDGRGAVRLLDSDSAVGLLILERILPGSSARDLPGDESATRAAAEVMAHLHRSDPIRSAGETTSPHLDDWFEAFARHRSRFNGRSGPLSSPLFDRAESLARELLDSTDHPILLHGDLHHENILAATREPWLAIDPKGVIGDPCFEVAPFLRNPMPDLLSSGDLRETLVRRLAIFHEHLGYDIKRMKSWVVAESILSAVWDINDPEEGWRRSVKVAEAGSLLL